MTRPHSYELRDLRAILSPRCPKLQPPFRPLNRHCNQYTFHPYNMLRQRRTHPPDRANAPCSASARTEDTPSALDGQEESMTSAAAAAAAADDDQQRPLLNAGDATATSEDETMSSSSWTRRNQWIVLALASGACAAFNGVFAKL